ncbi:MAG: hypothetical protein OXN84_00155 [Albidovulum sp.]|nr:hypothetical protein [Albidovulum sp.]
MPRGLHRNRFGLKITPPNLIALDGSEYLSSFAIDFPNCSKRMRNRGTDKETIEHFQSFLGVAIVAPEQKLALPPKIIGPQDGADKQDCERNAVKCRLGRIAPVSPAKIRSISATCSTASRSAMRCSRSGPV